MNDYSVGVISGIVGGLCIAALGMIYGAQTGRGLWALPNAIGGIVLGPEKAAVRSFGAPTLVGMALHVVLSAVYGIVIVFLSLHLTHNLLLTGLVVGIAVWLVNYYGVGAIHPGSQQVARVNPAPIAFVLHGLFGLITGAVAAGLMS